MPNPPASCVGVNPRGSSSSASGFPRVSARILSRTRPSSANRTVELSSARASPLTQAAHLEIRQVPELLAGLPRREHEPHRLGQQPASDERERQRRGLIQPLRVVDDAQQRTLLGHFGHQAEYGQADEEPIRGGARAQAEDDPKRVTLWSRQPLEPIEQRRAQLMQAREGQLHLGLHPHRPHDGQIRRRLDQVLQQRRLPDPGLALQHQRPALALADRRDQPVQQRALAGPAFQARLLPRSGGGSSIVPGRS